MSVDGFIIDSNVPIPSDEPKSTRKQAYRYRVFDEMQIGDSFVFQGTPQELHSFRAVIRVRNMRMKGQAKFFWDYENPEKTAMRVWRTA